MTSSSWATEAEFEDDWWSLADSPSMTRPAPPLSENLKKARSFKPSIYDNDFDSEEKEDVEYCLPSRGRDFRTAKLKSPGKLTETEKQKITQSQIREVAGLGYSNELIEQNFKNCNSKCDFNTASFVKKSSGSQKSDSTESELYCDREEDCSSWVTYSDSTSIKSDHSNSKDDTIAKFDKDFPPLQ